MNCPCCSGQPYASCCKPWHDGAPAPTPLALMRSRYSAYALGKADYIIRTTHPTSPYREPNRKKWEAAILTFCRTTQFEKLEIKETGPDWVHFVAHLRQKQELLLEEKSTFAQLDGRWLYVKGDFPVKEKA